MSLVVGCHLSVSKGFYAMGIDAISIGANTMQFFTRNPRGGKARKIEEDDLNKFKELCLEHNFGKVLGHASYTMNLCSAKEDVREFARECLLDDLQRMDLLPGNLYNFHPGSHTGQGVETGVEQITQALNDVLYEELQTEVLLETMAGKGSEIGAKFEELRDIIDKIELQEKIGVCLDTCHIFEAGYDIVTALDDVLEEFDKIVGIDRLKAIHLNDSLNELGAAKDRHAALGEGNLGIETIEKVINHQDLKKLPFFLETPHELPGYAEEIILLKTMYK